ncbi:MAG: TAXI family TRAP transporter solute-binding subunit [Bacillota bacterium]
MKKKWIKVISLLIILSFVITVAGCGGGGGGKKTEGEKPAPPKRQFLTITTASTGGTYYPIGMGMATLWTDKLKEQNINVTGQSSAGSVENIDILRKGEAQLAIMQGLIGAMAWSGKGKFEGNAYKELRSISMLWPNVEHFTLVEDKVKTGNVKDIKGLGISVGPSGSGTEESTLIIMKGLGLTANDIKPEYLGYSESADAMKNGNIDGASMPAGPPASAVTDLYASPTKVRVLDFTEEDLKGINSVFDTWYAYTIQPNVYPGQDKPINTIAQPNWLAVSAPTDEETVYLLTKTLFENLQEMHAVHQSAKNITLETALDGLPAPLHAGAYKYFKEKGMNIPDRLIPPEAK